MRNAEDTPADGFTRAAGAPDASGTPDVTGAPGDAPLPRRHPGANRPDWTTPGEEEALANAEALRYAAHARGAPWGPAPEPRSQGARPAPARSDESAPRSQGARPAPARSGESAPRSPGLRPPATAPVAVPGRPASRDAVAPPGRRRAAAARAQVLYLVVLACTAGGIVWAWRGSHDVGNGAGVVGGALFAAAVARLVLPQSAVGLLASRRRFADVLALGILGAGLLVLAFVLPPT